MGNVIYYRRFYLSMPAPIRLLLVMESTIGGTRRHLNQLALSLPRGRFDITVVASAERDATFRDDMQQMRAAGVNAIEIPMGRSIQFSKDRAHVRMIRNILRNGKFDIVHAHSSKAGALARYAALREGNCKKIYTPHTFGFAFAGGFSLAKRAIFYSIELALGTVTDRLICVSPSEAEQARRLRVVSPSRICMIENGVDAKPFVDAPPRESAREILNLPKDETIVSLIALLNSAKGQIEAVEAMVKIPQKDRPLLLCIGGVSDESYGKRVAALIDQYQLKDRVRLMGHRDRIPVWMAASNFILCPSRWEGMPYAVLEAMAAGRAVLATATNGAKDAVVDGETGAIVPIADADALAAAIVQFTKNPERCARQGEAGRARVLSNYSIEKMIQKTAEVYEGVLAR